MDLRRIRLLPVAMAVMGVGSSYAASMGNINVGSTIGEPLRAEIPILVSPDERLRESCFSLIPTQDPDSEVPTVTNGHLRLHAQSGQNLLVITTSEPVRHPLVRLNLRVGCNVGMTREYTLLMPAPVALPVAAPGATTTAGDPSARVSTSIVGEWRSVEGESLQSIAEALYPENRRLQQRFVRAAIDANRAIFSGQRNAAQQPLPQGLHLRIPSLQAGTAIADDTQGKRSRQTQRAATAEERETPPSSLAQRPHPLLEKIHAQQAEADRLQVGVAPTAAAKPRDEGLQVPTREQQLVAQLEDQIAAYKAVIDKINKMEAYAAELKREVDQLDVEIASAVSAHMQAPVVPVAAPASDQYSATPTVVVDALPAQPSSPARFALPDWLLGTLAGGAAIGVAALLGRRRRLSARPILENPTLPMPEQSTKSEEPHALPDSESWAVPNTLSAHSSSNVLPFAPRDDETAIDVSEHESAMELAEIMLSFGRIKGAAQVLSDYLESNPRGSIEPWLKLLELYREAGLRREFEEGAERLNRLYNVSVLRWEDKFGDGGLQSLERFAHIRDRLVTSWGTADCLEYLKRLLDDNRNGSRSGFALPVLDEILLLISILEEQKGVAQPERVGKAA